MKVFENLRKRITKVQEKLFSGSGPERIGIYGPANAGKTTLANRIVQDWTDDGRVGSQSEVPHETRRVRGKDGVTIESGGNSVELDIFDTPGVETHVDYEEFVEKGMDEEDAIQRSREATEGITEAMHWLREDIDGVLYVLDSTKDPVRQVNSMVVGIIESQDLPVLILANKIDKEDSDIERIRETYEEHKVVPLSALEGDNMDEVYKNIADYLG